MKIRAIPSDLALVSFCVTEFELHWIEESSHSEAEIVQQWSKYAIDVDFEGKLDDDDASQIFYEMEVDINHVKNPLPGYCIRVMGTGLFRVNDFEHLQPKDRNSLQLGSAVAIMIGSIRSAISAGTSYGILGSYTLPPLDLNALIETKGKQQNRTVTKQKKAIKGKPKMDILR